jgi:hypothetical protein
MAVSLSTLRAGSPLPPGRFLVLVSVRSWVDPRAILQLEGLSREIQWPHRESNPLPSGLQHSVITNYATACIGVCDWRVYVTSQWQHKSNMQFNQSHIVFCMSQTEPNFLLGMTVALKNWVYSNLVVIERVLTACITCALADSGIATEYTVGTHYV